MATFVSRWEAFCGLPPGECASLLQQAASHLGWTSRLHHQPGNHLQSFMLGSTEPVRCVGLETTCPFTVRIVSASADPVSRFVMGLVGSHAGGATYRNICLVTVQPVTPNTRAAIAELLTTFTSLAPRPPWQVDHPRFAVSAGLRWRTEALWRRWTAPRRDARAQG